jgi:hypothetical protein
LARTGHVVSQTLGWLWVCTVCRCTAVRVPCAVCVGRIRSLSNVECEATDQETLELTDDACCLLLAAETEIYRKTDQAQADSETVLSDST